MDDLLKSLEGFWLPDEIKNFEDIAVPARYREGSILFWDGDPSDALYFIESGYVEIYHYTKMGSTVTLLQHQSGDLVGVGGVLAGTVRKVYARTLSECKLWKISSRDFIQTIFENQRVAVWIATSLSDRLHNTDQAVLRVTSLDVERRLAQILLKLAEQQPAEPDGSVVLKTTHQDVANMIGACRQSTTTAIGVLKRRGLLSTRKGALVLLDLGGLTAISAAEKEN